MVKTCRCCLNEDGKEPIFHKIEVDDCQEITYSDMLTAITSNKVVASDGLPHEICCSCCRELKQAYKFRMKCDKAYETLMLLKTSHRIPVVLVKQTSGSPQADNSNEEFDDIFVEEDVDNDSDGDVKTIKVELDVEDNGLMYIEPLDDTGDVDNNVKDYIKPETVAVTEYLEKEVGDSANDSTSSLDNCPVCKEIFTSKLDLNNHIKADHPRYKSSGYYCMLCERTYKSGQQHIYNKHRKKRTEFDCSLCGKIFQNKIALKHHLEKHKIDGLFKCKDCPMVFKKYGGHNKHALIHKEKKHLCHMCSKAFVYKSGLNSHIILRHSEERKLICHHCSKGFFDRTTLIQHIKIHTNNKPILCDICPRRCRTLFDLRVHHKAVHESPVRTFICELCGMNRKSLAALRSHLKTHETKSKGAREKGEYPCQLCGKVFSRPQHRRRHERKVDCMKPKKVKIKKVHCKKLKKVKTKRSEQKLHIRQQDEAECKDVALGI